MINYATINLARNFAQRAQQDCDYAGQPYDVHNEDLRIVLRRFGFKEDEYAHLHVGAHMHDVFEDTDATPDDARRAGIDPRGIRLAELVTDEPGKGRKEIKAKTYPKIATDAEAVILKLADRISNVEKTGKINMYRLEHPDFYKALYSKDASKRTKRMWAYLNTILGYEP